MKYWKIYFSMLDKEQQKLAGYQYVEHHIEIVSNDGDNSNYDALKSAQTTFFFFTVLIYKTLYGPIL